MKFKDVDINKYSLLKAEDKEPCVVCKELTEYIEFCYEVRCCCKKCLDKLDSDYRETIERFNRV